MEDKQLLNTVDFHLANIKIIFTAQGSMFATNQERLCSKSDSKSPGQSHLHSSICKSIQCCECLNVKHKHTHTLKRFFLKI